MPSDWNLLMDRLARTRLPAREAAVVAAIARKTLGYRKPADVIATSQLERVTGISRSQVSELLDALEGRRVIFREGGTQGRAATIGLRLDGDWTCPTRRTPPRVRPAGQVAGADVSDDEAERVRSDGTEGVRSPGHTRGKGVNQRGRAVRAREGDEQPQALQQDDDTADTQIAELQRRRRLRQTIRESLDTAERSEAA